MGEIKCRLCGGETNDKEFCIVCRKFRADEVEALHKIDNPKGTGLKKAAAVGRSNKANLADECPITNTMPAGPRVISRPENKNTGGVKVKGFRECPACNTLNGTKLKACKACGEVFTMKATVKKKKFGRPQKSVIPAKAGIQQNKRGNGDYDGIMLKLITRKSEYQQKVTEIDSAIEVLKKYAA
ncbi:MAG: hypothetical protein FD156_1203 [Nitrospirae bacterium]|nr:MAG: hypothetical protein FD156_1203 [Nitrospirota bacterium]